MTAEEVVGLEAWTTPAQRALFAAMPVADQRHGLDVAAHLRRQGVVDTEVLVAGLLHDAGKGHTVRVWHRVGWSLCERYGARIWRLAAGVPGFAEPLERMRDHAEISAQLAATAGCSARVVDLIRYQAEPRDLEYGALLQRADEAC